MPEVERVVIISSEYPSAILDSWFFDDFTLADELFAKVLQSFETCLLFGNNLCAKLVSLES